MIAVVTPEQMGRVDAAAADPTEVLIERAGAALAAAAIRQLGGRYGRVVDVVAGKGNNGADGRAAARRLRRQGVGVRLHDAGDLPSRLPPSDLIIDAAYGTGFRGEWSMPAHDAPVLAADIPSGVDGLTGAASGDVAVACATVTFAAWKPGLLFGAGPRLSGAVEVADIGLPIPDHERVAEVVEAADVSALLPCRAVDTHKWKSAVRIVGGSTAMPGAPRLAAGAAMRAGAGIVWLSVPGRADGGATDEIVGRPIAATDWSADVLAELDRFGVLLVGPGLGADLDVTTLGEVIAAAPCPLLLDGDALTALGGSLVDVVAGRTSPTVLTPHEGEFAKLGGAPADGDRIGAVVDVARRTGAVVVLKGQNTIVAAPDELPRVVANGDQRLATAGSGDVLAGVIAALISGGTTPFDAATAGVWLHAATLDQLPSAGIVASDLIAALPAAASILMMSGRSADW